MKLLYIWVENHKNMFINQSFNVSSSYHIEFNGSNLLTICKNKGYIENFYGNNILDITAIVGKNRTGKTTIARYLYDKCESIHPCDDDNQYITADTKRILIYEKSSHQEDDPRTFVVHYYLSEKLYLDKPENTKVELIDLKDIKGEEFIQADQKHNITTVYFTNAFDISNVMINQGLSEFSAWGTHKSLCYTPMLSLHRAFGKLINHYGADKSDGGSMQLDVINQYARNMTTDFEMPYATTISYNYFVTERYFPSASAKLLPAMEEFKLNITEFGEYIKFQNNFFGQSQFNQTVIFIRKNIYDHISSKFKTHHWEQIYLNLLCEIVLFLNMFNGDYKNVNFEVLEKEHIIPNCEEAFERILGQITDNDENLSKKELIRKIRNVQDIDLTIITNFIELQCGNIYVLRETLWYRQVQNFLESYNTVKDIEIAQTINFKFRPLIELIIDQYNNKETVYGRMFKIIPQPMSSGEIALINIFATVYSALNKKTSESILLIIDEIDAFLHPEWQQNILTYIIEWINHSEFFNDKKVQLVLTTHSPIILSDIPKDNIIHLKKPFETTQGEQLTLGANIATLFYDSFTMKQGSIGAIARDRIQWTIDNIENENLSLSEQKKLVYIIDNIGDRFLREKLKSYPVYINAAVESRDGLW